MAKWGGLAGAGIGGTAGFFLGGPAGALTGAQLGYGAGSAFDKSGKPKRGAAGSASGQNMAGANFSGDVVPSGYRTAQLQQYTPEQLELFKQTFGHVGPDSYLSRLAGGDQSLFEEMEAPAMRQFQGLQGELASRFSGLGGAGALSSRRGSGFQNAANQQTADFAQDLAARRQGLQRQAILDLMSLSHTLLGERPYERGLLEKQQKPNFWNQILGGAAQQIPQALSMFANQNEGGGNPVASNENTYSGNWGGGGASTSMGTNTSGPYNLPTFGGW